MLNISQIINKIKDNRLGVKQGLDRLLEDPGYCAWRAGAWQVSEEAGTPSPELRAL